MCRTHSWLDSRVAGVQSRLHFCPGCWCKQPALRLGPCRLGMPQQGRLAVPNLGGRVHHVVTSLALVHPHLPPSFHT